MGLSRKGLSLLDMEIGRLKGSVLIFDGCKGILFATVSCSKQKKIIYFPKGLFSWLNHTQCSSIR